MKKYKHNGGKKMNRLAKKACIEIISAMYQLKEIDVERKNQLTLLLKNNSVVEVLTVIRDNYCAYFNMVDNEIVEYYNL